MTYPGGKGNCYQQIINQMPPHDVYIEPFLGGGYVMKAKRPAMLNIGVELDPCALEIAASSIVNSGEGIWIPGYNVKNGDASAANGRIATNDDTGHHRHFERWDPIAISNDVGRVGPYRYLWRYGRLPAPIASTGEAAGKFVFIHGDALEFLQSFPFTGSELVYCDPPYLMQTRSSQRALYAYEFGSQSQHEKLLSVLVSLPCHVAISGYQSDLYESMLDDWRTHTFEAVTRSGNMAQEWLWMNYPEPISLHDYSYLGNDFRERERIKRKAKRWVSRFQSLPTLERKAILSELAASGVIVNYGDKDQQE